MKQLAISFTLGLILFGVNTSAAQNFVYTPKNPAFGGVYYNYQWMLSSAQAQNSTQDPDQVAETEGRQSRNTLQDFEESLNRQILNQLSRQIVQNQFGESTLSEGTYTIGSFQLDVTEGLDGLNVVILDVNTGNQTSLFIPYY